MQKEILILDAAGKAHQLPVLSNDPVTGDQNGNAVIGTGRTHGAGQFPCPGDVVIRQFQSDILVAYGGTVGDLLYLLPDAYLEVRRIIISYVDVKCIPLLKIMAEVLSAPREQFIREYAVIRSDDTKIATKMLTTLDIAASNVIYDELVYISESGTDQTDSDTITNILKTSVMSQQSEPGYLHITGIDKAFSSVRKNLYIAGLSASKFPGSHKENYLLLDSDLDLFGEAASYLKSEDRIKRKTKNAVCLAELASALDSNMVISYSGMNTAELKRDNASSIIYLLFNKMSSTEATYEELERYEDIKTVAIEKYEYKRWSFEELHRPDVLKIEYNLGNHISELITEEKAINCLNLAECFLDISHKITELPLKNFTFLKDEGIYSKTAGNPYFNFVTNFRLVKLKDKEGNTKNFGFAIVTDPYPALFVGKYFKHTFHNALELNLHYFMDSKGDKLHFVHDYKIYQQHKDEFREYVVKKELFEEDDNQHVILGDIDASKLLYCDNPQVTDLMANLIEYSFLRDEFRIMKEHEKKNK